MNMQINDRKKIRNDLILATAVILTAVVALLFWHFTKSGGDYAVVLENGVVTARYALDTDTEVVLSTGEGNINILVIAGGEASVREANCPDGICVGHRPISHVGETIVCLPHKLVIKIAAQADTSGVDMAA